MILKNFFGKTLEAAKKSAQQMYGDNFLIIESSESHEPDGNARITVFSDAKNSDQHNKSSRSGSRTEKQETAGVKFEPSGRFKASSSSANGYNGHSKNDTLSSLRKFAEQQTQGEWFGANSDHVENEEFEVTSQEKNSDNVYSRSFVRKAISEQKNTNGVIQADNASNGLVSEKAADVSFANYFKPTQTEAGRKHGVQETSHSRQNDREIKALHKRFDKLEALLDSTLISANLDYASHPAFQQLVHTGINTTVIAGWFSEIIKDGIDPYDQSELFMSKLAGIIRRALGSVSENEPQKFMLFAGPSGAGKTELIMKLTQHSDFMFDKKFAVISITPPNKDDEPYFTILEPFCEKYHIPYFKLNNGLDVSKLVSELEVFDHVFIDTPSLSTEQDHSFREFWKIRQLLAPLAPLEVHYVVNAALNRFYFQNSAAIHHPLQPDYVAVTHLDEVSQWGPVIPFLQKMGCSARYISFGNKLNTLREFDPQWFAQKVLQEI